MKCAIFPAQTATHHFEARDGDELGLEVGDEIQVLEQPDGGWWLGQSEIYWIFASGLNAKQLAFHFPPLPVSNNCSTAL